MGTDQGFIRSRNNHRGGMQSGIIRAVTSEVLLDCIGVGKKLISGF